MSAVVLWGSAGLIFYCYVVYPLLIAVLARLFNRPVRREQGFCPSVSVILSVWNEADVIEDKINNLLSLDYPADKIEFLIGSDHSTDGTVEILDRLRDPRVRIVAHNERRGKMAMLNDLVALARHELLVFTDARQSFEPDALRRLVENFADQKIGCVSGELVFLPQQGGATARGVNLYWRYEKFIRYGESGIHSMLGATGAIYAVRRFLYTSLPESLILDDMFIPLQIIRRGYRAVFDVRARAYDRVAHDPREEFSRKARTLAGNYQIFAMLPGMFNPFASPVAWQLFSHKFLRLLVPFLMLAVFVSNLFLLARPFYRFFLAGQIMFYVLAACEGLAKDRNYGILRAVKKVTYVPYVYCLLNAAALAGLMRFLARGQRVTWDKARDTARFRSKGGC